MITCGRYFVQRRSPKTEANRDFDSSFLALRKEQQQLPDENFTPRIPTNIKAPFTGETTTATPRERPATAPVIQLPSQTLQPV